MQVYTNSNKDNLKTCFTFLVVLFLAYLPVATFSFFIKNDAFSGYFPPKFFMSESIHAGYLPLWNPYINFGLPQYGDMSVAYWNPVTWLIASTVGYNGYTFTLEELFYLLIAGIGMFRLCRRWVSDFKICVIAGIAYMCCGYNVGHLQHFNWVSGAAFLPWCLAGYLKFAEQPGTRNAVSAAVAFFFLFSAAHPGISIAALYFFLAVSLYHLTRNERSYPLMRALKNYARNNLLLTVLIGILCSGMIISYLDILPHITRGEKVTLEAAQVHPTNFQSWISSVFPLATMKKDEFFNTDISMRNVYFSLVLFVFFIISLFNKKTGWQKFLMLTGIIFLLLSTGGIFKTIAYKIFPFFSFVRMNGEFSIFTIFCFIIVSSIELDKLFKRKRPLPLNLKWVFYGFFLVIGLAAVIALIRIIRTDETLFSHIAIINQASSLPAKLKAFLDVMSFWDALLIQAIIQTLILALIYRSLMLQRYSQVLRIAIADIIIATLLNLPFSGVGKTSVATVQAIINKAPEGIPIPRLQPITLNDTLPDAERAIVGDWSFYNKQTGVKEFAFYPVALKSNLAYFENPVMVKAINVYPIIFSSNNNFSGHDLKADKVSITSYSPNHITINASVSDTGSLTFLQNYYRFWKVYNNEKEQPVTMAAGTFMSTPLRKGINNVEFRFKPARIQIVLLINLLVFLSALAYLVIYRNSKIR